MPAEADIESHFVREVGKLYNWPCLKLRIDGQAGFPDRTVLTPRGPWFCEFKSPRGGRLSAHQQSWRALLLRLGYPFCIATDSATAMESLRVWYVGQKH